MAAPFDPRNSNPLDPEVRSRLLLPRWVARAETSGLRVGIWVLLIGSFLFVGGAAGLAATGAAVALMVVQAIWSGTVAERANRAMAAVDPRLAPAVAERLSRLPRRRRTLDALQEAVEEVGGTPAGPVVEATVVAQRDGAAAPAADGLTCAERGTHAPGCPHRHWG